MQQYDTATLSAFFQQLAEEEEFDYSLMLDDSDPLFRGLDLFSDAEAELQETPPDLGPIARDTGGSHPLAASPGGGSFSSTGCPQHSSSAAFGAGAEYAMGGIDVPCLGSATATGISKHASSPLLSTGPDSHSQPTAAAASAATQTAALGRQTSTTSTSTHVEVPALQAPCLMPSLLATPGPCRQDSLQRFVAPAVLAAAPTAVRTARRARANKGIACAHQRASVLVTAQHSPQQDTSTAALNLQSAAAASSPAVVQHVVGVKLSSELPVSSSSATADAAARPASMRTRSMSMSAQAADANAAALVPQDASSPQVNAAAATAAAAAARAAAAAADAAAGAGPWSQEPRSAAAFAAAAAAGLAGSPDFLHVASALATGASLFAPAAEAAEADAWLGSWSSGALPAGMPQGAGQLQLPTLRSSPFALAAPFQGGGSLELAEAAASAGTAAAAVSGWLRSSRRSNSALRLPAAFPVECAVPGVGMLSDASSCGANALRLPTALPAEELGLSAFPAAAAAAACDRPCSQQHLACDGSLAGAAGPGAGLLCSRGSSVALRLPRLLPLHALWQDGNAAGAKRAQSLPPPGVQDMLQRLSPQLRLTAPTEPHHALSGFAPCADTAAVQGQAVGGSRKRSAAAPDQAGTWPSHASGSSGGGVLGQRRMVKRRQSAAEPFPPCSRQNLTEVTEAADDSVQSDIVVQQIARLTEVQAQLQHALAGLQASYMSMQGAPAPAPAQLSMCSSKLQAFAQWSAQAPVQQQILGDSQASWMAMQAAQEISAQGTAQASAQQQMLGDLQAGWAVMQAAQEVAGQISAQSSEQQPLLAGLQASCMARQAVQDVSAQGQAQHMHSPTMAAVQEEGSSALFQLDQGLLASRAQQQEQLLHDQLVLQVMQSAARQGATGGLYGAQQ